MQFEYSWNMEKAHVFKIDCHATRGFDSRVCQYDLIIDGQSFFNMPKVYEIGNSAAALNSPRNVHAPTARTSTYTTSASASSGRPMRMSSAGGSYSNRK